MKYNCAIVVGFFTENGLPRPEVEYKFHPTRKWRFDFAWSGFRALDGTWYTDFDSMADKKVALEVDGGIWIQGGHNRGAQIKATWEKENEAQCMGWRILKCEPKDLCTMDTVNLIRRALGLA